MKQFKFYIVKLIEKKTKYKYFIFLIIFTLINCKYNLFFNLFLNKLFQSKEI